MVMQQRSQFNNKNGSWMIGSNNNTLDNFREYALSTRITRKKQNLIVMNNNNNNQKQGNPMKSTGTVRMKFPFNRENKNLTNGTVKLSGTTQISLPKKRPGTQLLQIKGPQKRDSNTVFVAGCTGKVGSRVIKELLSKGFKVIAGARDPEKAKQDLQLAVDLGIMTSEMTRNLKLVSFDVENEQSILPAFLNAGQIVYAAGVGESSAKKVKEVEADGAIRVIETAAAAGIERFVFISSIGTGKFSLIGLLFNVFFNDILKCKREAEIALENSGMIYTIIRPSGMESPGDTFKEKNNAKLYGRDKIFGGSISNLQVAELTATCCQKPELAENKCIEISADGKTPYLSYEELLEQLPSEITREEQIELNQKRTEINNNIVLLNEQIGSIEETLMSYKETRTELESRLKELTDDLKSIKTEASKPFKLASEANKEIEDLKRKLDENLKEEAVAKALLQAAKVASRENRILNKNEQDEIVFAVLNPELAREREEEAARKAQEELERQKQEAIEKAKADAEAKKQELQRKAEQEKLEREKAQEEAKRIKAEEEEAKRIKAEEAKRIKAEEAKRIKAQEEEAKRKAEEAKRIKAEEEEAKRKAEEAKRIKAEEEARIKAQEEEEEAKRIKAQEEEKKVLEEAKKKIEEERIVLAQKAASAAASAAATATEAQNQVTSTETEEFNILDKLEGLLDFSKLKLKIPWLSRDEEEITEEVTKAIINEDDRQSAKEWIANWKALNNNEEERPSAKEWINNWRNNQ